MASSKAVVRERASLKSDFFREIASDHRPMAMWPPPDGHVATARWSRGHRAMVTDNLPQKNGKAPSWNGKVPQKNGKVPQKNQRDRQKGIPKQT